MQYLVCYACAGSQFQLCAMQPGSSVAYRFCHPLSLVTLEDRLQIILLAVQCYWIMKAQLEQLPPLASKVAAFDSHGVYYIQQGAVF